MAFARETARTPASIGSIQVALTDNDGTQPNSSVTFQLTVRDSGGQVMTVVHGDLSANLTVAQRTAIWNLLSAIRTKAANEIL